MFIMLYSASVLEGESDVVFTRLFVNDDDTDEVNTDSMIQLVSAFGVTNNTEGMYVVMDDISQVYPFLF